MANITQFASAVHNALLEELHIDDKTKSMELYILIIDALGSVSNTPSTTTKKTRKASSKPTTGQNAKTYKADTRHIYIKNIQKAFDSVQGPVPSESQLCYINVPTGWYDSYQTFSEACNKAFSSKDKKKKPHHWGIAGLFHRIGCPWTELSQEDAEDQ